MLQFQVLPVMVPLEALNRKEFKLKLPSEYFAECETDKIGIQHNYGMLYDMVIEWLLIRSQFLRVLEVGCSMFGNGSGHAFARMPFVEKYVGVDAVVPELKLPEKFIFLHGDAYSESIFETIEKHAPFDLVIDDGSHLFQDQLFFMQNYGQFCKPTSVMICEDVFNSPLSLISRLQALDDTVHAVTVPGSFSPDFVDNLALVKWNRGTSDG